MPQHACFDGFFMLISEFLSLCLLHHWALWFFSQWNLIVLLYTLECFSPGESQGVFTSLCLFLKSMRLGLHCVLTLSFYEWKVTHATCHATLDLFLELFQRALLCIQELWLLFQHMGNECSTVHHSVVNNSDLQQRGVLLFPLDKKRRENHIWHSAGGVWRFVFPLP